MGAGWPSGRWLNCHTQQQRDPKPHPIRSNICPVTASQPPLSPHPLQTPVTTSRPHIPHQTLPAAAITSAHHHAPSSHVTKPRASQVSSDGKRVAGEICGGVYSWHAVAFPPPLPRFSPIAKIPPHPLDLLPVPRVLFVSQACPLAIMMQLGNQFMPAPLFCVIVGN